MLIFDKGLRIKFWNVGQTRLIDGKILYKEPIGENSYMVDIISEPLNSCILVHEDQIAQVLIKDFVDNNNIWIGINDLRTAFHDGETISWYTRYHKNLPKVRYQQLSTNSLNYVIHDEKAVGELLFEDACKRFLKEDKKMNFLSFEVEHSSIWDSDAMRCRLEFEMDAKEAWKYEPLMKRSRNSLQIRQFGEFVLSAFLDATNLPKPKKVIFHGPATIVMWQDGTKTVVKKTENDTDDREKAVMFAILKKVCGSRGNMNRYLKLFKEVESNEEKKEEAGSSELCQCEQGAGSDSSESTV